VIDSINPVAALGDMAALDKSSNVENVERALNKMYFDIMLKSAFQFAGLDEKASSGVGIYTDVYLNQMVDVFAESHQLGFGQLQLNNELVNRK
jgi:Rod binding domain-containing protein